MRIIAAIAGIILVTALLVWACNDYFDWKQDCANRGGHVTSHTDYYGKHSNTTYYCISPDGRILDIR
jgi:hypothetical protein